MDFLNEFSKRVSSVARSMAGNSKESAEVARLNSDLQAAEAALEQLYTRYGKACYALREGRGGAEVVDELALRIRAARLQVEEISGRRDAARELKRCLGCGAVFPKEARYCSACGKRLPEEAPKPEPAPAGEYCPNCGAAREGAAELCPVCGAAFVPQDGAEAPPAPVLPAPDSARDVEEPDGAME